MNLTDYVLVHAIRGGCKCGKCIDAVPYDMPPNMHTINLTFMEVSSNGGDKDEFLKLVRQEFPNWLDGGEHNYIEIGADMGDQGLALMTIGLGGILGAWNVLSPETLFPSWPSELKMKMAGSGLIAMQAKKKCP